MKNKLLSIVLNPYFLALFLTGVILYFLPDFFNKYEVKLIEESNFPIGTIIYFEDLNNNGKDEKIGSQSTNHYGNASFIIYSESGDIIDQFNFNGKYPTTKKKLWFGDINDNGFQEIYLLSQIKDSIFLNIFEPFVENGIDKQNIFIDNIHPFKKEFKITSSDLLLEELTPNEGKSILIQLNTGYVGYPRNLYKINLKNNKVVKSKHLTNHCGISKIIDLNNDGSKEILIQNSASCNSIDSLITPRSDCSSWLNILDKDLNFSFQPIEFAIPYSTIHTFPVQSDKNQYNIICLLKSRQNQAHKNKLLNYSSNGVLLYEKNLASTDYNLLKTENKTEVFLYDTQRGIIESFNLQLEQTGYKRSVPPNSYAYALDLSKDKINEWLFIQNEQLISIYDNDFRHPVSFSIPKISTEVCRYGLKKTGNKTQLYFQKGNTYYMYDYFENPIYIFKYLVYAILFLMVFGLIWIIRKGQQLQLEKKQAIENEIAQLQIKAIKNQVDPHFVFNAVNTISEMLLTDDKLEADNFISKFSKLMRETLQNSDKISTPLKDEIDYVENYIQLQRIRFNNSFDYQIKKDNSIDYNTKVPKHVLYSYVENAIKHGLSNKHKDGLLTISVTSKNNNILLSVEDNGNGMDKTKNNNRNSTGNGMEIMEKMYALYNKLYQKKITHTCIELFDENKNKTGLRIEIVIGK
jgi:hypothetical protein